MSEFNTVLEVVPGLRASLVDEPDILQVWGEHRECDARTALTRGVADYMERLTCSFAAGRLGSFNKVLGTWATVEDTADFPCAVAYTTDQGAYDGDSFSTQPIYLPGQEGSAMVDVLQLTAELTQSISVEVWTTDPEERMALSAMLEDAFNPVQWMAGFRLDIPYYFNARATYLPINSRYDDNDGDAQRGIRKAIFTLEGSIPVVRHVGKKPKLVIRTQLTTT